MAANQDSERLKREAARRALDLVEPGMRLGLGTGTTARHFVDLLGEKVAGGLKVRCVATSEATLAQAKGLSIPMTTLDDMPELDLTVDGADEVDPELRLIKGGGGALLREKIVAAASLSMAVIADASKAVARLGAFPLPVEVVPFGLVSTRRHIEKALDGLGVAGRLVLRGGPSLSSPTAATSSSIAASARSPTRSGSPRPCPSSRASSSTACSSAMRAWPSSPAPTRSRPSADSEFNIWEFVSCSRREPYPPRSSRARFSGAGGSRGRRRAPRASPTVPPPSPAAVHAADQLLIAMGVKESIAKTVPT